MGESTVSNLFEILEQVWPTPVLFLQTLKKYSANLITEIGHPILPLLKVLKKVMSQASSNHEETDSWKIYCDHSCDEEYATTSFPYDIIMKLISLLQKCVTVDTTDNYSLSPITNQIPIGSTSTSSMIADGPPGHAGVAHSRDILSIDDDELSGQEESDEVRYCNVYISISHCLFLCL